MPNFNARQQIQSVSQMKLFRGTSTTRNMSMHSRPFQVLGLQQIAIGNTDKGPLSNLWTNILGVQKIGNFKSTNENVDEDILRLGKEGSPHAVEVDLMMPIDEGKSPKVSINIMHAWYSYCIHVELDAQIIILFDDLDISQYKNS